MSEATKLFEAIVTELRRDHRVVFPVHDLAPGKSVAITHRSTENFRIGQIAARTVAHPPDIRSFHRGFGGSKRRGRRASWLWSAALLTHYRNPPPALASLDSLATVRGTPPNAVEREHMLGTLPMGDAHDARWLPVAIVVEHDERVALRVTNHEQHRNVSCTVMMIGTRL